MTNENELVANLIVEGVAQLWLDYAEEHGRPPELATEKNFEEMFEACRVVAIERGDLQPSQEWREQWLANKGAVLARVGPMVDWVRAHVAEEDAELAEEMADDEQEQKGRIEQ